MKHFNWLFALTAATALFFACAQEEENLDTPSLTVSETALSFSQEGGATEACTIFVTSNRDWTASCESDWVYISPTSGSASSAAVEVVIYVDANTSSDRSTTVKIASSTISKTVSISQEGPSGSAGTYDNPYTVEEALAIINNGSYTSSNVYVHGYISQIDEVSTSYGNATYYISDDGQTTSQLEVYHGYYIDGAKFTSEDQIAVGDEVIVCGQLTLYYSTPEVTSYSTLYMHNGTYGTVNDGTIEEMDIVTVAEVLAGEDDVTYRVKGVCTSITNTTYGNWYLQDETGSILIYGTVDASGSYVWSSLGIEVGDTVTVQGARTTYNTTVELKNVVVIEIEKGSSSESGSTSDDEATGDGSLENPYNAAGATAKAEEIGTTASTESYYVKGIISSITELSTSYGNATFYISDDGSTSSTQFLIYRAYSLNNSYFTSETEIEVGDEVVVYGQLINYYGNTPEMTKGGYLISITKADGTVSEGETPSEDENEEGEAEEVASYEVYSFESNTLSSWTLTTKAYSETAAINGTSYSVLKLGTSSVCGEASFTIPAGSAALGFYAFAWNNKGNAPFTVTVNGSTYSYTADANSGFNNNTPYTVTVEGTSDYHVIAFDSALEASATVTLATTSTSLARVVFAGINSFTEVPEVEASTPEAEEDEEENSEEENNDDEAADTVSTVAEVLAGTDGNYYTVTGVCTSIANTYYGNWYLEDETGSILIYGTVDASGSYVWSSLGIEVGDTVTVYGARTTFGSTIELKNVVVTNIVKGESTSTEEETEEETSTHGTTADDPYTVAEVLEMVNSSYSNSTWYYVKGYVTSVGTYSSNYSSLTYYIGDTVDATSTLCVYSGYGLDNAKFSSADELAVGSEVVVYGYYKWYNTYAEVMYNNYIVSLVAPTAE